MYREHIDLVPWILSPTIFTIIDSGNDSVSATKKNPFLFLWKRNLIYKTEFSVSPLDVLSTESDRASSRGAFDGKVK